MSIISIEVDGVSLLVEYTYHKASRGARDSLGGIAGAGPPLEPDEPESVDVESVRSDDDIQGLLSEDQIEQITRAILEKLAERREDEHS